MGILGSLRSFSAMLSVVIIPLGLTGCGWWDSEEQTVACSQTDTYKRYDPGHVVTLPESWQTTIEEKGYAFGTLNENGRACASGTANVVDFWLDASYPVKNDQCRAYLRVNLLTDPEEVDLYLYEDENLKFKEHESHIKGLTDAKTFQATYC